MRAELAKRDARALVVSMLDEVAWLLNLRGSDIDYNPVFFAYALVEPSRARVFVDTRRLGAGVRAHLGAAVEVAPYDAFFGCLAQMGAEMAAEEQKGAVSRRWARMGCAGGG